MLTPDKPNLQRFAPGEHQSNTKRLAYSVAETAHLLGVSRAWLYQRWANGEGPPRFKIGARALIPAVPLVEWIAVHTATTPSNVEGHAS